MSEDIAQAMGGGFNPADVDTSGSTGGGKPVPKGWHECYIDNADVMDTKDGKGKYLFLDGIITNGMFEGRHLFCRINFVNSNPVAVEIGQRELAEICVALGIPHLTSTDQLKGQVIQFRVKKHREYQGDIQEEVGGFRASGNTPAPQAQAQTGTPPPAQTAPAQESAPAQAPAKRPWE